MKVKFNKNDIFSFIELMPDGTNESGFRDRVEVYFLDFDSAGRAVLNPTIDVNATLMDLTPEQASEWAEILRVSGIVSELKDLPQLGDSVLKVIREAKLFFDDTILAICDRCGGVMPFLESNQKQAKALGHEQLCNECCAEMVFDLFDLQGDDYKMRHDQVEE